MIIIKIFITKHYIKYCNYNRINIIIKTNVDFEISFVNKLFEITTSFTNEELKSKSFLSLKHSDITSEVFELIQKSMNLDISWNGIIKYITKDENTFFIAETYIMPTHDEYGKTNGYLCILSDITEEQSKKRNIQMAMMKDKGDIFSKSKSNAPASMFGTKRSICSMNPSNLEFIAESMDDTNVPFDAYF